MKIYVWLETGFAGQNYEDTFEINDDATEEEIEEAAKRVAFDRIDWGYKVLEQQNE